MGRDTISLKRFSCEKPCKSASKCGRLPIELHRDRKGKVDILFLTEFPGKNEVMDKQFLTSNSRHGAPFRRIIQLIEDKYGNDWSYGICGLFKAQVTRDSLNGKDLNHCTQQVLEKEIKYCNPRVIITLGEFAFKYIFKREPKFGMYVENNRFYRDVEICGESRDILCLQHPTWGIHQKDANAIGYLYEGIRRAIDYVMNGIHYNIPDKFKSEVLTNYDDVKDVLKRMRKTPEIVAVDTEDDNLNKAYENNMLSLQLSCDGKTGFVIPVDHYESPFKGDERLKKLIYNFFTKTETKTKGYVFVNAKFDYHQFYREEKVLEFNAPILDCSFGEFSLDENWTRINGYPKEKGHFSLFTMSYKRGFNYYADSDSKEMRAYLSHLPLSKWAKYGGADVVAPWQIFKTQLLQAKRTDYLRDFKKLNYIFFQHLVRSCMYCEHCGISINYNQLFYLYSHAGIFTSAINEVMDEFYKCDSVKRVNDKLAKESTGTSATGLFGTSKIFNPSKSTHREMLYFDELKLEPVEDDDDDDKNSGTTGKEFQKQYKGAYREVELLEQFNTLSKMKTGFVNPVFNWMNLKSKDKHIDFYKDKRARSNFSYLTVTGRLRSFKPNSQQRPSRGKYTKDILSMYCPPKGRCLVKLDYVTFEVKGLGFISGDKAMIKSFREMHELKKQYRANPTCFYEEGYKIEKASLDKTKKDLQTRKKQLKVLKKASREDYNKSKITFKEDLAKYKKDKAEFEHICETRPQEISHRYLVFQTDFHRRSAALFNSLAIELVTKAMRQNAKGLVFGCFTNDTIVSTQDGPSRLGTINNKPEVMSSYGKLRQSDGIISKGIKPIVQVITRHGNLKGTSAHKVMCITEDCKIEMKPLGLLKINDMVVNQRGTFGNNIPKLDDMTLSLKDVEAMGLFTADGSANIYDRQNYRVHHCSVDRKEVEKVRDFIYKIGNVRPEITRYKQESEYCLGKKRKSEPKWVYMFQINNKKAYQLLLNFGLLGKQNIRHIPNDILNSTPEYVGRYLRGYFDGDGGIRKSNNDRFQIFLSSMNVSLLTDVCYLLNLFDISSHIYKSRDYYELVITNADSITKFSKFIGFGTKHKHNRLQKYIKRIKRITRKLAMDKYNYPMSFVELRNKYAIAANVNTFRARKVFYKNTYIPPLVNLQNVISNIDSYKEAFFVLDLQDEWKCLKQLNTPGCKLSRVIEEAIDIEAEEVFDIINVEKSNKWTANGIIVSNSIYGRSVESIAKELKIELSEAQKYFDLFMSNMPQAGGWLKEKREQGQANLYVESPLGRRRRLWGYIYDNKSVRNKMDRLAMNTCVSGNTLVDTSNGIIPIKDLVDTKFKCIVNNNKESNNGSIYKGKKDTLKLETECGFNLRGTPDHEVQILDKDLNFKMKRIDELTVNDYICIERKNTYFPNKLKLKGIIKYMTPELARLLGYLVSDGSIYKHARSSCIHFSQKDESIMKDYINCWKKVFNIQLKYNKRKNQDIFICTKYSNKIGNFFKYLGFSKTQSKRLIPWSILQSNKECVIEFLKGLFEGDGSVNKKHVFYGTTSRNLINELRTLLLKLGIYSNLYDKDNKKESILGKEFNVKRFWFIHIVGKDYNTFLSEIGFISDRKKNECKIIKNQLGSRKTDFIPHLKELRYKLSNMLSYKSSVYNGKRINLGSIKLTARKMIANDNFIESAGFMLGTKLENKLKLIREKDYLYSKVKSVGSPKKIDVYDIINVTNGHKFVANNLVISNCIQGICSDCNLIATSLLLSVIYEHGKSKYQVADTLAWFLTNLVHDSCEMETPVYDVYYVLLTFEALYTNLLEYYIEKAFGFKIKVPLEVDFTVGVSYAKAEDWDGSEQHARELQKWILEECGKRDNVDYMKNFDKCINNPMFKNYKGIAKKVVNTWIKKSEKLAT